MKNIKHFIWDFDGTLADTYPNLVRYLSLALADFGVTAEPVEIHEKMMETVGYAINWYSEHLSLPELSGRYDYYYALGKDDPASAFPGVASVLEQIEKNGGYNYIFTNRGESVYALLEQMKLQNYFTEIVRDGDPEFEFKPSPRAIIYLMEKYGGSKENTAMVGDRKCDLESGYNAGCKTIHLLTPSVPQYPACDWRVSSFQEMLSMLK